MSKAIQLLLVEDSDDDARMIVRALQRAGFDVRHRRVEDASTMAAVLAGRSWDAVISDYNMPGFSGLDALRILRAAGLDLPFILVSGTAGEEIAVDALKAGAGDYVLKKNLSRLPMVLERELKEAAVRAEHQQAEADLRKLSVAVRQSGTGIVITDPSGAIEFVNPKFEVMTGYSASDVKGKNPRFLKSGLTPPETFQDLWQTILAGNEWSGEIQNRKKSGELYIDRQHISPVLDECGKIQHFIAVKEDITEQKRAERELQQFRMAMDASADSIYLTDPATMRFIYLNNTACEWLGYSRAQLLQMSPQDVLSMDREEIRSDYDEVLAAGHHGLRHERRFVRSDGGQGWSELHRRVLSIEGAPVIVTIGRDITERKAAEARIRRLNRVYAVLSGINALIVRARDRDQLFREACRIAVESGGFLLAWLGLVEREEPRVKPVAWHGAGADYIGLMSLRLGEPGGAHRGLIGEAVWERKAMISDDMTRDSRNALQKEAAERGFRSLVVLPLLVDQEVAGVLALYAGETGFFDEDEMKLLHELAGDIAFALDGIGKREKLDYLAFYDQLTGLANRSLFLERVKQSIRAIGPAGGKFALAILDIERLRTVNASLGRQAGDELLRQMAARLAAVDGASAVGRIGADHFALILGQVKGRSEAARSLAAALNRGFIDPFRVDGQELRLAAKAGAVLFPADGADAETLLGNAEATLRKAKHLGERQLFHTTDLTEQTTRSLTLETKLRQALEREEFVLHYQPKVDVETRQILGVEALIRWQSSELGLVPPLQFIRLMEETGLILEVGNWALCQAVRDHALWLEQGLAAPRIAVNVSAIQLRRKEFLATMREALAQGAAPAGIDLEITESLVMEDIQGNVAKLGAIRELGVEISIDDFGTGYSSLAYLARLPVQVLKIDRSFVSSMLKDADTMTLVSTIISLAHSLRLKVVAEGVEEEEQAKILRLLRCDQMQGYLFSRPMPFDQMTALLCSPATGATPLPA